MKRISIGLAVLVFTGSITALVTAGAEPPQRLDDDQALAEATSYLSSPPMSAEIDAERWVVSNGTEKAWLDARTGELVEIEFAAQPDDR
jgi:hypothetical protein